MIFYVNDIIKDVRVVIDENVNYDTLSFINDVNTLSLNEIIKSKIVAAAMFTHCNAPVHLLDGGYNFGESIYWNNDNSGWTLLPEDFLRLVVFQMSDWDYPLYSAILPDTPEYRKQFSRFKGIKGSPHRPQCAISIRPDGRALEFFSCKNNNATVIRGVYLPYPEIDKKNKKNGIEICERCYQSFVYKTASLTLLTVGENDKSIILSELANNLLL